MGNEQTERLSVTVRPDQIDLIELFRVERGDLAKSATVRRIFDEWATLTGRAPDPVPNAG